MRVCLTRTYKWSIAKSVTPPEFKQIGGTATFNYTVSVQETGFEDNAWMVKGQLTSQTRGESISIHS